MAEAAGTQQHLLQASLRYIERGDESCLSALLREQPEVARLRTASGGEGAIHAAAKAGRVSALKILLDAGADPNMPEGLPIDEDGTIIYEPGYVALGHAAHGDHEIAVSLLLERGANPSARDQWGGTPLHAARSLPVAVALLGAGANANAVCHLRHFDETLGWHFVATPLHVAAQAGGAELLRMLVEHGGRVSETEGITGRTPLHYAAARGNLEATRCLLQLGADPNAMAEWAEYSSRVRMTPLHYAASEGHLEVVQALLKAGASASTRGGTVQETASTLAAQNGHFAIAKVLDSGN